MNPRLFEVALRRERLIERIGVQRERLAQNSDGVRRVCAVADGAVAGVHRLAAHPEWLVAGAIVLVVIRPRRAWNLAKTGFITWRTWVAIRRKLAKLLGR